MRPQRYLDRQLAAEARRELRKVHPAVRAIRAAQLLEQQIAADSAKATQAASPTEPVNFVLAALDDLKADKRRAVIELVAGVYPFSRLQDRAREILAKLKADDERAARSC